MNKPKVYWVGGGAPTNCDACGTPITNLFYDMKTTAGPWGCLCNSCAMMGPGIGKTGTGYGQKYQQQTDGRWLKTEG